MIGAAPSMLFGSWAWGLRGTPILGAIAVILMIVFLYDPPRGGSEGLGHLKRTSYWEDIVYLSRK